MSRLWICNRHSFENAQVVLFTIKPFKSSFLFLGCKISKEWRLGNSLGSMRKIFVRKRKYTNFA